MLHTTTKNIIFATFLCILVAHAQAMDVSSVAISYGDKPKTFYIYLKDKCRCYPILSDTRYKGVCDFDEKTVSISLHNYSKDGLCDIIRNYSSATKELLIVNRCCSPNDIHRISWVVRKHDTSLCEVKSDMLFVLADLNVVSLFPDLEKLRIFSGETKIVSSVIIKKLFEQFPEGLKELDLSCNNLNELPDKVEKFKQLERLKLACNALKELPIEKIKKLKQLKEIDVSHNCFALGDIEEMKEKLSNVVILSEWKK